MILHGDSLVVLPTLAGESVDSCVTDPPYELEFMGKGWDASGIAFNRELWRAVLSVMKPGAYLLAFGGTRTYHRLTCAIEDAGFEIRDCIAWLYGSGFPKSLNLGEGLGTALKPAFEPIVLARKPFKGSVKANVEQHGTGALNIDACRIETGDDLNGGAYSDVPDSRDTDAGWHMRNGGAAGEFSQPLGRWPANVCLDELAAMVLDEQSGELITGGGERNSSKATGIYGAFSGTEPPRTFDTDIGGASRFYYVAKPSREERDMGCYHLTHKTAGEMTDRQDGSAGLNNPRAGAGRTGGGRNFHPTVKPVELMRWLVKLVTPIGGTVIDPFLGSGTTGMACVYEQREFIGIERDAEYVEIATARIASVAPLFSGTPVSAPPESELTTQKQEQGTLEW